MIHREKRELLIRVDGGPTMGMGHLIRCLALAEYLKTEFSAVFYCRREPAVAKVLADAGLTLHSLPRDLPRVDEPDYLTKRAVNGAIVVLDGYEFDESYQTKLAGTCKLLSVDDLGGTFKSNWVLNHSPSALSMLYHCEAHTQRLFGPQYALLRPEFLNCRRTETVRKDVKKVMVCLGGADPRNDTMTLLEDLDGMLPPRVTVTAVVGPANVHRATLTSWSSNAKRDVQILTALSAAHMAELFAAHDLFFGTPSGVALEAFAIGIPAFLKIIADNQRLPAAAYEKHGVATILKSDGGLLAVERDAVRNLLHSVTLRQDQVHRQQALVDRKSPERIRNALAS